MPETEPRRLSKAESLAAANTARAAVRESALAVEVQEILDNPAISYELKLKLVYCQKELHRRHGDGLLTQRRRELMREARR